MTDFYGGIDSYLPSVPTDTDLNFYGKVDNFLSQDISFYGNVNNFLYFDSYLVKPITYTATGTLRTLDQTTPVMGGSWDGTNFTAATSTNRVFYSVDDNFDGLDNYSDGELDGQSNAITLSFDYALGRGNLDIAAYAIRSTTPASSFVDISSITTTPTGLDINQNNSNFFISSDADATVYEVNSTATIIVDTWTVDLTDCAGVAFIDTGNPATDELWVTGRFTADVIGYNYQTKEEIGRFTVPNPSNVRDITYVAPFLWMIYSNGIFRQFSRD